ncbi:MAG: isoprenyl transferase [Dethiobacter sp.]|jgi:undecaprenyl diphosphate synthase|nr:MAG: isoprenyl transferase [Dethiobacter sp.]
MLSRDRKKNETELTRLISAEKLPGHVAIIMDGNGRWARKRGLPRIAGHRAGINTLKEVITCSYELGISIVTLYAFSTENWKRPRWEVEFLMSLPGEYLHKELQSLIEKNIIIKTMGNLEQLPEVTQRAINNALEATRDNSGMILNFALNYGGRNEILNAVRKIAARVKEGSLKTEEISEDLFAGYLDTGGLPDPDLLIRPSGELRISNFLLWQLAYTELWFTRILWPDFKKEHFLKAILDYQERERRFGGINKL